MQPATPSPAEQSHHQDGPTQDGPSRDVRRVWWLGLAGTVLLSAGFALVAFLSVFMSAFCADGGPRRLAGCLTAIWGLGGWSALTLAVPVAFLVWGRRAADSRQAWVRLGLCALGYLPPVLWFLGLLRFWFD
jgi:hypothetical protein